MAAPKALDDRTKAQFLHLLSEGFGKTRCAQECGVTPSAVKREMLRDQEFAEQIEMLLAMKVEKVEEALYLKAVGDAENGQGASVEAMKFFLANRSEEWTNTQRIEHTGKGGGPMVLATVTTEALMAALAGPDTRQAALDFIEGEMVEEAIFETDVLELGDPGDHTPPS